MQLDLNKDVVELVSRCTGIWNSFIEFDDIKYWDDKKDFPYRCEYEVNPLPSDCRYRNDLLYLIKNDLKKSQNEKELMEEH